jgi:predicted MPP superfamily phosphohydrolase
VKTIPVIFLPGLLLVLLVDFLFYRYALARSPWKWTKYLYWSLSILFLSGIACYHLAMPRLRGPGAYPWAGRFIAILLLYYIPRGVYLLARLLFLLKRGKWIARAAATIALVAFLAILDGVTAGRYRYEVTRVRVTIPGLPPAFDGLRVAQLSDLHLGSHGSDYPGVRRMVERVNAERPDVVVLTGDVVNNFASEILPWTDELRAITARLGKFAVTGNHDHGDYTRWRSPREKEENARAFLRNMAACGFRMLNDESFPLASGGDTLYLCGVQNWRPAPLPSYGNLERALRGSAGHVVILLSHDPAHWREQVIHHPVALTLSGHTHAMQVGLQFGKYHWTPARYFFPEYNGLYARDGKQLHVSRGAGYLGVPGRIGQRPEITLLQLAR